MIQNNTAYRTLTLVSMRDLTIATFLFVHEQKWEGVYEYLSYLRWHQSFSSRLTRVGRIFAVLSNIEILSGRASLEADELSYVYRISMIEECSGVKMRH